MSSRHLAATSLALLALMATAAVLRPDASGTGTHRQLGLPACVLQQTMGIRCPACGMTTSWSHLFRGDWNSAMQVNVGGCLLGICGTIFVPWSLACAYAGRWLVWQPTWRRVFPMAMCWLAIIWIDWLCRVVYLMRDSVTG